MARYRSIKGAMLEIKNDDPDTSINESMLRKLIVEGYISSIRSGWKYMVNMDDVYDYLEGKGVKRKN